MMHASASQPRSRASLWRAVAVVLAFAYAVPLASEAYDTLMRVNQHARERLIREHRLWELQPDFRGKPEVWTRTAARLLSDRQLLTRLTAKYGVEAQALELEYRRDLAIARAEVVALAVGAWALPVATVAALVWGWGWRHRRRGKPPKVQPASVSDPRYRPPENT